LKVKQTFKNTEAKKVPPLPKVELLDANDNDAIRYVTQAR
jgi:hypothetical protein